MAKVVTYQMQKDGGLWVDYVAATVVSEGEVWRVRKGISIDGLPPSLYESNSVIVGERPYRIGFSQDVDEGTVGDFYVSKTGSDSNPGTLSQPFLTFARARTACLASPAGKTVVIRAGVYREVLDLQGLSGTAGNHFRVQRYGTEVVRFTGREPIQGLEPCTISDIDVAGPNWSSIYKATMPVATFAGSPMAAFPWEDGNGLVLSTIKAPFPFRPNTNNDMQDWLTAEAVVIDEENRILGYRFAEITDAYTEAQLQQAQISFHHYDNRSSTMEIAGVADGVIIPVDQTKVYENNANRDKFMILNMPAAIQRGEWGYKVDGSNVTIYLWPRNPANVAAGKIEYSARSRGVNAQGTDYTHIRGIIVEGVASDGASTDGNYAYSSLNGVATPRRYGLQIINCEFRDCYRNFDSYGVITLSGTSDVLIRNVSIRNGLGQTGISTAGSHLGTARGMDERIRIEFCDIDGTDRASIRMFGASHSWIAYTSSSNCGHGAHANKANFYENCRNILVWGCVWTACGGYFTWQEASGIHTMFCIIPAPYSSDGRTINDQNRVTAGDESSKSPATQEEVYETGYICQNLVPPYKLNASDVRGIVAGKAAEPYALYELYNNITNGVQLYAPVITAASNNAMTSGALYDPATDRSFGLAEVYEDFVRGDLRLKQEAHTKSMVANDMTATIAALSSLHPDFPWLNRDIAFNEWDAEDPFVGPYASGSEQIQTPAVWVERGNILGINQETHTLTITVGYYTGSPWPALGVQWIRAKDVLFQDYEEIAGATDQSYVLQEADVGHFIGVIQRAGGAEAITVLGEPVAEYVEPPVFDARGVNLAGLTNYNTNTPGVIAGDQGFVSMWFRNTDTAWNALAARRLLALETGAPNLQIYTASTGRMSIRVENDTGTHAHVIYAAPGNVQFQTGRWYHIAMSWNNEYIRVFVDGVQVFQFAITGTRYTGNAVNRFGVGGGSAGGNQWPGEMAHVWMSMIQWIDLSNPTNMAKLLNGKSPANMGNNGELVTGTIPEWYFDGPPETWGNKGTGNDVPRVGPVPPESSIPVLP